MIIKKSLADIIKSNDVQGFKDLYAPLYEGLDKLYNGEISASQYEQIKSKLPDYNSPLVGEATPIMAAAQNGYWGLVVELYNLEADVDVFITHPFWSFAHEVVMNAPIKMAKNLVESGELNLNHTDYHGRNLVMLAVESKRYELVEPLLQNTSGESHILRVESDVHSNLKYGSYATEVLANAPLDVVKKIMDHHEFDFGYLDYHGRNPLMLALEYGRDEVVDLLLEKGVRIDAVDSKGNNVAHYAAKSGNHKLFLHLMQNNISIMAKNQDSERPVDLIEDIAFRMTIPVELDDLNVKSIPVNLSSTNNSSMKKNDLGLSNIKRAKLKY